MKRHKIWLALCVLPIGACGKASKVTSDSSALSLTNALPAPSLDFPGVVLIALKTAERTSYCVASFVNDYQALTSASCTQTNPEARIFLVTPGTSENSNEEPEVTAEALGVHVHPDYHSSSTANLKASNLAVVNFPSGTAPGTIRIRSGSPSTNDSVTLVSFARLGAEKSATNQEQEALANPKQYGLNTIQTISDGYLTLSGLGNSLASIRPGQYVGSSASDIGGPWLVQGTLVSVTSGSELRQLSEGRFVWMTHSVDLNASSTKNFLASVLD